MGSAISGSLAKGNYRLLLKSPDEKKLENLVDSIRELVPDADIESATCASNACWEADIIILAVPYAAEKEVAEKIREVANQKIVISIANPLNERYTGLVTASDTSAAEELQKLLPNSRVVKAFNTTFPAAFSNPIIAEKQVDAFIAGNDEDAVNTVSDLVSVAGFNPINAGALPVSRTLEHMQLLLISLGMKHHYHWLAGWKILHH